LGLRAPILLATHGKRLEGYVFSTERLAGQREQIRSQGQNKRKEQGCQCSIAKVHSSD
jgi:hypothetical protein